MSESMPILATSQTRPRLREIGVSPGVLPTGPLNAISDVPDVRVGHLTLIEGDEIRTGATAVLPHRGNLYQERVPAGLVVGNGYGKLMGISQVREYGELETPIVLTNTLCVPRAADAILDWTLRQPGNEMVGSINPLVGETNDSGLNNIRKRVLTPDLILEAIEGASSGPVAEGAVGAGTGTIAFEWKGGIGTSSRVLPESLGGYTIGVLVQTNFGGVLQIMGAPIGVSLGQYFLKGDLDRGDADGSIMIVVATNAPLSDRNLTRLARRSLAGLARTGASWSGGSGDYAIAFSTDERLRRTLTRREQVSAFPELPNEMMSPLFLATIEATEEAIYNSLFKATTTTGYLGRTVEALPLDKVIPLLKG